MEDTAQESMKDAMEEAVEENKNECDLTVALDGFWIKKRIHITECSCHKH
jgi:hypothetical protein